MTAPTPGGKGADGGDGERSGSEWSPPTPREAAALLDMAGHALAKALNARLAAGHSAAPMFDVRHLWPVVREHRGQQYVPAFDAIQHAARAVLYWATLWERES